MLFLRLIMRAQGSPQILESWGEQLHEYQEALQDELAKNLQFIAEQIRIMFLREEVDVRAGFDVVCTPNLTAIRIVVIPVEHLQTQSPFFILNGREEDQITAILSLYSRSELCGEDASPVGLRLSSLVADALLRLRGDFARDGVPEGIKRSMSVIVNALRQRTLYDPAAAWAQYE